MEPETFVKRKRKESFIKRKKKSEHRAYTKKEREINILWRPVRRTLDDGSSHRKDEQRKTCICLVSRTFFPHIPRFRSHDTILPFLETFLWRFSPFPVPETRDGTGLTLQRYLDGQSHTVRGMFRYTEIRNGNGNVICHLGCFAIPYLHSFFQYHSFCTKRTTSVIQAHDAWIVLPEWTTPLYSPWRNQGSSSWVRAKGTGRKVHFFKVVRLTIYKINKHYA